MRKPYIPLLAALLLVFGCRSYSLTERSGDFKDQKSGLKKLLVLPPEYVLANPPETKKTVEETEAKGRNLVKTTLLEAFRNKNVETIFLDSVQTREITEFFEYIVPLKRELLTVSELHEDMFKQKHRKVYTNKTFARVPKIQPRYMALAQKYGVRYALFAGVFGNKNEHYQYVILADLIRSEIVFRNLKHVSGKARKSNVEPIMYDTFLSLHP